MYENTKSNMGKIKYIRDAAAMLVQFHSYDCGTRIAGGRIQTLCYKYPFEFRGLDQMLLIMDDVLDSVGFEKEPEDCRGLYAAENKGPFAFLRVNPEELYTDEDINNRKYVNAFSGELMIWVSGRQSGSIQGELRAGERIAYFRSSLELLRMLYEYLERKSK